MRGPKGVSLIQVSLYQEKKEQKQHLCIYLMVKKYIIHEYRSKLVISNQNNFTNAHLAGCLIWQIENMRIYN